MHMVAQRMDEPEERALVLRADVDAADHGKPAKRRHIGDQVVDVRKILTIRIQRGKIPMHAFFVQRRTLERAIPSLQHRRVMGESVSIKTVMPMVMTL